MSKLIKIISISNCHAFDGQSMSRKEFEELLYILEKKSKYQHTVRYEDEEGTTWTAFV